MKELSFKSFLPHVLAVAVFLLITVIFFYPVIFEGKVMTQNDVLQGISAGQEAQEYRNRTGNEALWTNSMFSGMPTYLINIYWSGDISRYVHDIFSLYLPSPARYTFLGMLCFYILLLTFRVNPYLAIAGGITYGINSFFIVSIEAGHIWKVSAIAYMPLVIAGVHLVMQKKNLLGIGLTALAVALQIRSNHIQISYYLFLILLVFWIVYLVDAVRNKTVNDFAKSTAIIAIAGLLGVASNIGKLWTSLEYSPYTIRGKSELKSNTQSTSGGLDRDYAFAWSNGVTETLTFLVPHFYGGASGENVGMKSVLADDLRKAGVGNQQIRSIASRAPTYWGEQPFVAGPIYTGIIVLIFFVLAIQVVKGPLKIWLLVATALGFMLSWGKNFELFNYLMFDYFPLYNKFRAVSMTLAIPVLCIPLLGFVGLSQFLQKPDRKILLRTIAILGGLVLLILLASLFMDFKSTRDAAISQQFFLDALVNQRASMLRSSAFRSLIFIAMAAGLLYYFHLKRINQLAFYGLASLLIFVDLYTVDTRYVNKDNFSRRNTISVYKPDQADTRILQDDGHYRVVNLTADVFNDAKTSYFHASIGGYHGAKMRRYQDLIEKHLGNEIGTAISQIQQRDVNIQGTPVLNMLNTKYFKLGNSQNAILHNGRAMGNAWFVEEIRSVPDADACINAIGEEDLTRIAISEKLEGRQLLSKGNIDLIEYDPNYLKYTSSNDGDGFAVFSEIYYEKGWKAFIDGKETPIHQVNYVLRGIEVTAGDHEIEFRFEPGSYFVGNKIMWVCSLLAIFLFIFAVVMDFRRSDSI